MINIALCDDEPNDLCMITDYIDEIMTGSQDNYEIYVFHKGRGLLDTIDSGIQFDLAFLDFEMEGVNGLQVGLELRAKGNQQCLIIFVSSHSEVILQLLDARVFNFIEKPINKQKFETVFLAAYQKIADNNQRVQVMINRKHHYIEKQEIILVESVWRQLRICTAKQEYLTYEKLDTFEKELISPFHNFVRVHKSYIVNLDYATEVGNQNIKLCDGTEVKISETYVKSFLDEYHLFIQRRKR